MSFHSSKWPPLRRKNNCRDSVIFCLQFFLFGIIVAVKSISDIKGGYAMWFSPVNCPLVCSSFSFDNNNDKLRCIKLLRWQQCVVPLCMSQSDMKKDLKKPRLRSEARNWNAFLRTCVQCGDWQASVERVSLIAGILKKSGHCIFLYEEKYYVIMHKHSQAYLTKNCHMSLDALK